MIWTLKIKEEDDYMPFQSHFRALWKKSALGSWDALEKCKFCLSYILPLILAQVLQSWVNMYKIGKLQMIFLAQYNCKWILSDRKKSSTGCNFIAL